MAIEACQNCGRNIGKLEQAYIYKDHIVCEQCNQLLHNPTGQKKTAQPANSKINDPEKPTHSQLRYAEQLGIKDPQNITKWELSELISEAVEERDLKKVQTIEKTGKSYKAGMLTGGVLIILAALLFWGGNFEGAIFCAIAGVLVYFVSKVLAWWEHG